MKLGRLKLKKRRVVKERFHAREKNHLNLLSSVSVYISFEKRILATSCGFIRLIAPTNSAGKNSELFVFIIVRSIKTPPLRFTSFFVLCNFWFLFALFNQTISAASYRCVYRCKRMCLTRLSQWTCLVTKQHQTLFGDQTFHCLVTLFGAV